MREREHVRASENLKGRNGRIAKLKPNYDSTNVICAVILLYVNSAWLSLRNMRQNALSQNVHSIIFSSFQIERNMIILTVFGPVTFKDMQTPPHFFGF